MKNNLDSSKYGPWAIVTGASSGIGEEFAKQLAAQGFNVVLAARSIDILQKLGEQLMKDFHVDIRIVQVDFSNPNAYETFINEVSDLDIGLLISNAGTGKPGEFLSFKEKQLSYILQLNLISHMKLAHYFGNRFARRGRGGILFTGAMGAGHGLPYMANESGTKAYVQSLGQGLNYELRRYNVNVTVLVTSPTKTPVLPKLGFSENNMPMRPILVKQCVDESLRALTKNKPTIIPGRKFRIINRLVPPSLSRKMMGKLLMDNNKIL